MCNLKEKIDNRIGELEKHLDSIRLDDKHFTRPSEAERIMNILEELYELR